MNRLSQERRSQVLAALVEGNSIRATCRMTGVAKATVLRLLEEVGEACIGFHDRWVRNINARAVQADEIWSFVHTKERHMEPERRGYERGDAWTWTAIDADTKLVISWLVGSRSAESCRTFMADLADRLENRIQLTTDGLKWYRTVAEEVFGWGGCDFAQLEKQYMASETGRYSPPIVTGVKTRWVMGRPKTKDISTSYVERQNLTMRMHMRRFTRLTNGFSKKLANHIYAVALHYVYYNFMRPRATLTRQNKGVQTSPAMAAGLADRVYKMSDLVRVIDSAKLAQAK
jgi:IS1 family transposase